MPNTVVETLSQYPDEPRSALMLLRDIVYDIARNADLGEVTESLKWGEPSFRVKSGSALRMDWKPATPNYVFLYFHCQTKLVDTFRELYSDELEFQGNRAIVIDLNTPLDQKPIEHCMRLAMTYHQVKHLPLLGA